MKEKTNKAKPPILSFRVGWKTQNKQNKRNDATSSVLSYFNRK